MKHLILHTLLIFGVTCAQDKFYGTFEPCGGAEAEIVEVPQSARGTNISYGTFAPPEPEAATPKATIPEPADGTQIFEPEHGRIENSGVHGQRQQNLLTESAARPAPPVYSASENKTPQGIQGTSKETSKTSGEPTEEQRVLMREYGLSVPPVIQAAHTPAPDTPAPPTEEQLRLMREYNLTVPPRVDSVVKSSGQAVPLKPNEACQTR